jgi:aminopeptidase N
MSTQPARPRHLATACLTLGLTAACGSTRSGSPAPDPASGEIPMDTHSFSRPREVVVTHVNLELTLDFEARAAPGEVQLELERLDPAAPLRLDTANLAIEAVRGPDGDDRPWTLAPADEVLGQGLTVQLEPGDRSVTLAYRTTPEGGAMQWLDPEQTAGGTHPFVFTQGQSILTRSWIPLQDSPGVRVTYEAEVRVPEGLTAVMSAEQRGERGGVWRFRMEQPIPPYLIALACGKLEFREISERCGVYAEPVLAAAAAAELEDTEDMLQEAEKLYGP